jgi:hypothetical protein
MSGATKLAVEPLTADRWTDLVELFGRPGASIARGCYCMCYRRSGKHDVPAGLTYSEDNMRALKALVDRGVVPGLIGYEAGRAIGWVSVGPREDYAKLARSPATLLEAYPCDKPAGGVDDFMWFGAKPMFDRAGFVEVARRRPTRPLMRKVVRPPRRSP